MTALHHASFSGELRILGRIWKWPNEQHAKENLNILLLSQDNHRRTAWYVAADNYNVVVIEKLWEWAKKVLTETS